MTDRIDHAAEARRAMNQTLNYSETDENTGALVSIAAAQVHATLALAEQQRIANLIALAASPHPRLGEQVADDAAVALAEFHHHADPDDGGWHELRPGIAAALGIETGADDD